MSAFGDPQRVWRWSAWRGAWAAWLPAVWLWAPPVAIAALWRILGAVEPGVLPLLSIPEIYLAAILVSTVPGLWPCLRTWNEVQRLRGRERGLLAALDALEDVVFLLDRRRRHTPLTGRGPSRCGPDGRGVRGRTAGEIFGPGPGGVHEEAHRRALAGERLVYAWSLEVGGQTRHFQTALAPLHEADGSVAGAVGVTRDVTDAMREAEEARRCREFALAALDALASRVCVLDEHGTVVAVNAAWRRSAAGEGGEAPLGPGANYLQACAEAAAAGDEHARLLAEGVRAVLTGARPSFELEYPVREGERTTWWLARATRFAWDGPTRVLMVHDDVTERRLYQEQLAYQALHDGLTGLPNRQLFRDRLEQALRRVFRRGEGVAVLVLDLDDFKQVNDTLGHGAGDELLRLAAQRLRAAVRAEDTVARLSGDDFAILLEGIRGVRQALGVAERVTEALREPLVVGRREVLLAASVGIAYARGAVAPDDLLRRADIALYQAKRRGKAQCVVYEPAMGV